MLRDDAHLFRRMWAHAGWGAMGGGRAACWDRVRDDPSVAQPASDFFDGARTGRHCYSNWYEGNPFIGSNGHADHVPRFPGPAAPALLGFDDSISEVCAKDGDWNYVGR